MISPTYKEIAEDWNTWEEQVPEDLAGEFNNYTKSERLQIILMAVADHADPLPAGPDPAAPATHQAWEEVMDARLAIQHLESKAQEYAAGLFEPEDITPEDRRDMRLYLISARACLTQAERLFGLV